MTNRVDTKYTTDENPKLKNPERGIYYRSWQDGDFHTIVAEWLWLGTVCGENLTWNGLGADDTSRKLNDYAQKLEVHRKNGVKVLFRPRYDEPESEGKPSGCTINGAPVFHADSKDCQFNHIDAIAEMLGNYRDVIAYIQAGYLGRWGEWNADEYSLEVNGPLLHSYTDRSDIIDRVLSAYAAAGVLQDVELRRPVFAKEVVDRNSGANVGLHNDCFMSNDGDFGTYATTFPNSPVQFDDYVEAMEWAVAHTAKASFGGETCPVTQGN